MTLGFDDAIARIAAMPEPAWLWDGARLRIVFANQAALAWFGEARLADLIERRFAADDPVVSLPGDAAMLRDGRPGLLVTAEEASETLCDPLFDAAPAALAVFDGEGHLLKANDEARALLIVGELGIVLSSPYAAREMIQALGARSMLTRIVPVATPYGMRRCRISAKRMGNGMDVRLMLSFDDVEDRLALEDDAAANPPPREERAPAPIAARAESAPVAMPVPEIMPEAQVMRPAAAPGAMLEEVVAALSDATLAANAEGDVIAMNARAAQLLGESARGEPLFNILPVELKADAAAYITASGARGLERALEDGRETRIQRGTGEVPVRATFARLATGEVLVQFKDLSSSRAAEDALRRAREDAETSSQRKSEFLAQVSHELRTPLNAIIGFADIMQAERFGPVNNERYRGYVHDIHSSGELLLSLINDLLDLSKAEAGRIELEPDAVELKPIILSVVSLLSGIAEKHGVTLQPMAAKNLPAIVADPRSLKQILMNLTANAIKYNRDGGSVEISASMDAAGAVHIAVQDDGPGMDAEEAKAALEPYRRTRTGRGREGTGLGLPLAKALTEANKAHFTLESAPGKGTRIRLTFPSALVLAE